MKSHKAICLILLMLALSFSAFSQKLQPRQMESLSRGVVAINQGGKAFVSWRMFGTDADNIAFNLYRTTEGGKAVKLNDKPIDKVTFFIDEKVDLSKTNTYFVRAVQGKNELAPGGSFELKGNTPARQYLSIPLQTPAGYTPNDASVGDLDGDGEYEIILHQTGRGRDNSQAGMTDPPILQAYKMDGTLMWSINLGKNIREGAHYTQFMVYDLDGDGRAEIACKTADGTIDGKGKVIGDAKADWVSPQGATIEVERPEGGPRKADVTGKVLAGPEFLTVFDGITGAEISTVNYDPPRHPTKRDPTGTELNEIWGDGYGNRSDRFLAAVAYLDGVHPSLIFSRGYYTRTVIAAWDLKNKKLTKRWVFDSDSSEENRKFRGQGNHNLSIADVDADGRDEIVFGAMVLDDNGKGLHSTGFGHGDALHVSDLDPDRPGLEIFDIQERFDDAGAHFRDARTGEVIWKKPSIKAGEDGEGPGRGLSLEIDPRHRGFESWVAGAGITGLFNVKGEKISEKNPRSCNFGIFWDGDVLSELLNGNAVSKWNWEKETTDVLFTAEGSASNNGSKSTPALSGDLFGDWREEFMLRSTDNKELRIYTTTIPTKYRFYTFMHDPQYRLSIAWQNVAYNQPPHTSFFIGEGMKQPPRPNITTEPRKGK
ncbi:MAG TPA: rhamnogalacturonan lyase [Pyrinomonadaceae bacterium]|nr:rhamnogalacturonan lyase [Pyrinomonadaceae bacterium]